MYVYVYIRVYVCLWVCRFRVPKVFRNFKVLGVCGFSLRFRDFGNFQHFRVKFFKQVVTRAILGALPSGWGGRRSSSLYMSFLIFKIYRVEKLNKIFKVWMRAASGSETGLEP